MPLELVDARRGDRQRRCLDGCCRLGRALARLSVLLTCLRQVDGRWRMALHRCRALRRRVGFKADVPDTRAFPHRGDRWGLLVRRARFRRWRLDRDLGHHPLLVLGWRLDRRAPQRRYCERWCCRAGRASACSRRAGSARTRGRYHGLGETLPLQLGVVDADVPRHLGHHAEKANCSAGT